MDIRTVVKQLRKRAPALFPVRVYFRDLSKKDYIGCTELVEVDGKPSHFRITLQKNVPFAYSRLVLIHEWAHAVAWRQGHEVVSDHGPEWAIEYARLYQLMIEQ